MNKWKIGFWCCLAVLLLVICVSAYSIIDQAVTLTYQNESYSNTENDLESLIEIINGTDLNKNQIEEILKKHRFYDWMDFKADTIPLERISLVFGNEKLLKVIKQW